MNDRKRIIQVVPYDPDWPTDFRKESKAISEVLSDQIVHIHHIGSTAVPGLAAKPVIDIMLEVKNVALLDDYDSEMEGMGYTPKGELGIRGRRFYLKGLYHRTHHIHAFNVGSPHVLRHLAFRDYLIGNPSIAEEYEELKVRCVHECDNDNDRYCEGKEAFVCAHEKKAMAWMKCQQPD